MRRTYTAPRRWLANFAVLAVAAAAAACSGAAGRPAGPAPAAGDEPAPIRHSVRVWAEDGTTIYYEDIGEGPPVVLIHGLGGNHAVWFRVVPALSRSRRTIAVAQRGYAPSGAVGEPATAARHTRDLLTVLDHAGIEKADIVGQSMGAWTALRFALEHPERCRRVVVSSSTAGIWDEAIYDHHNATAERARQAGGGPRPLGAHPALSGDSDGAAAEYAYLYQLLSAFGAPPPIEVVDKLGATVHSRDALESNRVPVLFLAAEEDPIFPPRIVKRAATKIDRSKLRILRNAGHSAYFETPAVWLDEVEAFLSAD